MALNELGRYIVYIQNQKKRQLLTAEGSNAVNTEVWTGSPKSRRTEILTWGIIPLRSMLSSYLLRSNPLGF